MSDGRDSWDRRYRDTPDAPPSPTAVLRDYAHLLPSRGHALDLACGRGGNALLLARAGLAVDAWDLSAVAIVQLDAVAAREGLAVVTQVRDVVAEPPPAACYDAITVGYFLDRRIAPAIAQALRPGVLLFYQTFGPERVGDRGPRNGPDEKISASISERFGEKFSGRRPCVRGLARNAAPVTLWRR